MAESAANDLAKDTAVTRLAAAPGWFTANLCDAWDFRTPSGGVLMTVAMRAMQAELDDPELLPLSANTHFCSPVPAGPLEIRVEILRHGRAAAQVRAQLASTSVPGPGLEVSATFARRRDGLALIDAAPPDVPRPENCPSMADLADTAGRERPRFFANFDSRLAAGNAWWTDGWEPGPARLARWFRYNVPQRTAAGALDPLALPPIADTMPPSLIQKVGPDHPPFFAPSLDLTVHFLDDSQSDWFLTSTHARWARFGYATADNEIWDGDGRLLACATQMMFIRNAPDAPLAMRGRR